MGATIVQLNQELVELLDRRAAREGVSRSQVIREAIRAFLAGDRETAVDRQIVDGYTRMPQGGEYDDDERGDLGGIVSGLTVEQFRRLNEEEREAGFEPW